MGHFASTCAFPRLAAISLHRCEAQVLCVSMRVEQATVAESGQWTHPSKSKPYIQVRSEKKRKAVRKALLDARESSPLFDVPLWTRSFEAGLSMALDSLAGPPSLLTLETRALYIRGTITLGLEKL